MIINTFVIVSIVVFYLARLFIYKTKFEQIYNDATYTTFNNMLINNLDLMAEEDGLFENEDGSYSYRGNVDDNYCLYCGQMYRILRIESDGRTIIVSENGVTNLPLYEYDSFQNSGVYSWLNSTDYDYSGIFENTLISKTMYLAKAFADFGQLDGLDNVVNNSSQIDNYITIPTVYDYLDTVVNNKTFLNNGEAFWLSNTDSSNNYYYVDADGSIGLQYSKAMSLAVRPVLSLNYTVYAEGGKGTIDDPYLINESSATTLNNAFYGSYVKYDDYLFRICDIDANNNVTLIMKDVLYDSLQEKISMSYGKVKSYQEGNAVYNYLNNEFLKNLTNYSDIVVKTTYGKGLYGLYDEFAYTSCFEDSYDAYVAIPNASTMYLNDCEGYFLAVNYKASDALVYIYGNDICHADYYSNENYIRPMITVKGDTSIISGEGTATNPYIIIQEVINETSE